MNVVSDSSDCDTPATDVLDDSSDVGPTFRSEVTVEVGEAILGAEDEMCEQGCESVAHH
jgi:hypothetical protein